MRTTHPDLKGTIMSDDIRNLPPEIEDCKTALYALVDLYYYSGSHIYPQDIPAIDTGILTKDEYESTFDKIHTFVCDQQYEIDILREELNSKKTLKRKLKDLFK